MDDKQRAKQVLLEIIRQSRGDEIAGKLKLFKAFYLAHLYYAKDNANFLSEWPIVRMPNGPGIHNFDQLIEELEADGVIEVKPCKSGPYPSTKYVLTPKGRTSEGPEPEVVVAIKKTVDFVADKRATDLSELTHEYSKSWNDASDGDVLPIYLDLLDDKAYREAKARNERIASHLKAAWE